MTYIFVKPFVYPILIAIGSSTDNLTVGFTLGLKNLNNNINDQKGSGFSWYQFNFVISICNSFGAWVAGKGGLLTINRLSKFLDENFYYYSPKRQPEDNNAKNIPSLLAAVVFSYLSIEELKASFSTQDEDDDVMEKQDESAKSNKCKSNDTFNFMNSIKLALPMTLNNLAGGTAGGALGISAEYSFIMAFICSYIMMDIGFRIASRIVKMNLGKEQKHIRQSRRQFDANILSAIIFAALASSQFWDYCNRSL